MSFLALEKVSIDIGRRRIVEQVSFVLEQGTVVGLIGPNGAGKTTLLRAVAQLLPVAGGTIRVDGRDVAALAGAERARRIAYLPQGGQVHWPFIVRRLVALGRLPHLTAFSAPSREDEAALARALAACDVLHLADRPVTSLSGGERSLVLLARALAVEAQLLLVDEPVASLDPAHQIQVMDLLQSQARGGRTVLVVLHDLPLATRLCDRLILMHRGQVAADGTADEVLTPARLAEVYGIEARFARENGATIVIPLRRR